MVNNALIFEALLGSVTKADWTIEDNLVAAPKENVSDIEIFKYVEFDNDTFRVNLYNDKSVPLKESVELEFDKLPEWNKSKKSYDGGSFIVKTSASNRKKEAIKTINHSCGTGGKAGFEGAKYFVGNLVNMISKGKGYRPYYQFMAHTLQSMRECEKELGMQQSPLHKTYYNFYKEDIKESIEYLLNIPKLDNEKELDKEEASARKTFQEWSGWYGLGATLVNVLNMELTVEEEKEMVNLLAKQEMLPYYTQILLCSEFTSSGLRGLSRILAGVRNIFFEKLPKNESGVIRELMQKYGLKLGDIIFDKSVKFLNLSHKQIRYMPETIMKLKDLRELYLNSDGLEVIPESIGQLEKLEVLELRFNHLTKVPDSLGRLVELRRLSLDDNKLKVLPETLGQLEKLSSLNIGCNKLAVTPESIGRLKNLKVSGRRLTLNY